MGVPPPEADGKIWDSEGCLDRVQAAISAMSAQSADIIQLEGDKLNRIDDQSLSELLAALQGNESVTRLDLSLNAITDAGAAELAGVLKSNTTLLDLELDSNSLSNEAVSSLCDALRSNSTLTRLDLSNNPAIDDTGAKKLAEALLVNTSLLALHLRSCSIKSEGLISLCETLRERNTTLQGLFLSGNQIDDQAVSPVCELLKTNSSLVEIGLANNAIPDKSVDRLLREGLEHNHYIQRAHLSVEGKRLRSDALAQLLRRNRALAQERETAMHQLRAHYEGELLAQRLRHEHEIEALRGQLEQQRGGK